MAKLTIKTHLSRVILIGEFCDWDMNKAVEYEKKKGNKNIIIDDMPTGEYKILSCRSWWFGEEKSEDGGTLPNRVFTGDRNRIIQANL